MPATTTQASSTSGGAPASDRNYWVGFCVILMAGLAVRLSSLSPFGFFCDVPHQITAIESKRYVIQFPGYVPYHLVIAAISALGLGVFKTLWLFSLACVEASAIYIMLTARNAVGNGFSLMTGVIMSFGVLPVYFSMTGTSYPTDMLCVAGMVYHGWGFIRSRKSSQYYLALGWLCFGLMMRPASAAWCVFGVGHLLWLKRDWRTFLITILVLGATTIAFMAISIPFFGSLKLMLDSASVQSTALADTNGKQLLVNFLRLVGYPVYGFHLWLAIGGLAAWQGWRTRKPRELVFLIVTVGPYCLFLARYIPHMGYHCLVTPALVLLPACFPAAKSILNSRRLVWVAAAFLVLSTIQWYLLRPVKPTNVATCVADAYFLQYSRAGLKSGMDETLSTIMSKNGVGTRDPDR